MKPVERPVGVVGVCGFGGSVGPPFIEARLWSGCWCGRWWFGGSVGPPFIEACINVRKEEKVGRFGGSVGPPFIEALARRVGGVDEG